MENCAISIWRLLSMFPIKRVNGDEEKNEWKYLQTIIIIIRISDRAIELLWNNMYGGESLFEFPAP